MVYKILGTLDIGSSKITAVIAAVSETEPPKVIGTASVPAKGIRKGLVINIEEAVNSIAQALNAAERMADVTLSSVIVSVSGKAIKSKNNKGVIAITHEEITQEDVYRVVDAAKTIAMPQGYDFLHIIPREYTIDSQPGIKYPIGMTGSRLEVDCHIILAPTSIIKNLGKCVQSLGMGIDAFVFNGWADTYSTLTDTEKELGVTLIDIGAGTTDIVVFQDSGVVFTGSIPVGGMNITNDIAVGLQIASIENAEKLKLNYKQILDSKASSTSVDSPSYQKAQKTKEKGKKKETDKVDISYLNIPEVTTVSKKFLKEIVETRLEEILDLAKAEVARAGYNISMPAGVVVTGGTAKLQGLTTLIKKKFNVPARIGIPKGLTGMIDEISGPEYATAQGLILYGIHSNLDSIGTNGDKSGSSGSIGSKLKNFIKSLLP